MSRFFAASIAVIIACSSTLTAIAATSTIVRGVVTVEGKPTADVKVTLAGEGSKFDTKTDATGNYVFSQIPFGRYVLTAVSGNLPPANGEVIVTSDSVSTVNLAIVKSLTEIANMRVIAHSNTGPSSYAPSVHQLDRAAIQTSPVQNSLDQTLATLPGVVPFSYNEPIINGFHGVTYNLDGAPLPLATTSNFAEIVDPRNIDSIELLTGAIPAEYGGDRMGGVVNIITNRPTDVPAGFYGTLSGGIGNQNQYEGSLDTAAKFGASELFFNANSQSTTRGLDAPTFDPIHDNSSQSDQFLRFITQLNPRTTLAFDYSNQLAQFEIPINTDPNNEFDPITTPAGTDDVQREYDRFSHLTYTESSKDGNGIFSVVPWWRSTKIDYDGDLANDVLGLTPDFGSDAICATCFRAADDSAPLHNVGLQSNTYAEYLGLRMSDFRATKNHSWKIGFDVNRENLAASQTFACYYADCADGGKHAQPYYSVVPPAQAQAGSQVGIYAQDSWKMGTNVQLNYGLRYDHSTGYTGGWMFSPRIGISVWDGGKNTAHAFYGRFYAAPLLEDVRQDCVLLSGCTGEPVYNLQPERDAYFEIGMDHAFSQNFTGSINVFRKSVVNVLDTTQLLNTPLFAVFNNAIGLDNGAELRLQQRMPNQNTWFYTLTYSGSYAAGVSGSTFLFPPDVNPPGQSLVSQLAPEDHDETVVSTAGYTWRFGNARQWYTTLQGNYGSGFPVEFEDSNTVLSGRLPVHTAFDLALGRYLAPESAKKDHGLAPSLIITNLLNHQYVLKVANGFNTTQIANGRTFLFKLQAPF